MKKNLGLWDRLIRVLIGVLILILYISGILSGTIAAILLIAAGVFIVTSFMSFCPIYFIFGLSSRKKEK